MVMVGGWLIALGYRWCTGRCRGVCVRLGWDRAGGRSGADMMRVVRRVGWQLALGALAVGWTGAAEMARGARRVSQGVGGPRGARDPRGWRGPGGRGGRRITWARVAWAMQLVAAVQMEGVEGAAATMVAAQAVRGAMEARATEVSRRRQQLEGVGAGSGEERQAGAQGVRRALELDGQEEQGEEGHQVCRVATLNVDGRMRLEGRDTREDWGGDGDRGQCE